MGPGRHDRLRAGTARRAGGLRDRGSLAGQPSRVGRRRRRGERRQRRCCRRRAGVTVHRGGILGPHLGVLGLGGRDGRSALTPRMGCSTRTSGKGRAGPYEQDRHECGGRQPDRVVKVHSRSTNLCAKPAERRPPPSTVYNGHSFSAHENRSDRSSIICGHHPTSPSMVRSGATLDSAGARRGDVTYLLPRSYACPAHWEVMVQRS